MIHRRELLLVGAGVVAAKATASALACASEGPAPEGKASAGARPVKGKKAPDTKAAGGKDEHAGHEGHEGHKGGAASAPAENIEFAKITADCVAAGESCLAHCLRLLGGGDTSMADCSKRVNAMLAVCKGTGVLAVNMNEHLATAAKLCGDVCNDCAEACKKHVDHHAECKACYEACQKTVAAAKKFA